MLIFIFYSHLKMTSERSKRRGLLSLIFITKCISKKFLINYWCYWLLVFTDWYLRDVDGSYRVFSFFPKHSSHFTVSQLCCACPANSISDFQEKLNTGLSTTFQIAGKILSSRIVVIKCRRWSHLGGSGSMVPQEIFTV